MRWLQKVMEYRAALNRQYIIFQNSYEDVYFICIDMSYIVNYSLFVLKCCLQTQN